MHCRTARSQIALWIGQDLNDAAQKQVQQHLADCPNCSDYWLEFKTSNDVLQQIRDDSCRPTRDSIWPAVKMRIAYQLVTVRMARFNGWLPATVIVAACLLLAVFIDNSAHESAMDYHGQQIKFNPTRLPHTLEPFYRDESWRPTFVDSNEWSTEPDHHPIVRVKDFSSQNEF